MAGMGGVGFEFCVASGNHSPKSEDLCICLLLRASVGLPLGLESLVQGREKYGTHSVAVVVYGFTILIALP